MNKVTYVPSLFDKENFDKALQVAEILAQSDLVPKEYKGKPANILIAMQMGLEIGLPPLQAIQGIAVINGRPCIWGDAMLALVINNPVCEWVNETPIIIKDNIRYGYKCNSKRVDYPERETIFTIDDAKRAGLWGKSGPWTQYPNRMLQLKARSFHLRDLYADILKGLKMVEEVQDYEVKPEKSKTISITDLEQKINQSENNDPLNLIRNSTSMDDLKTNFETLKETLVIEKDRKKEELMKIHQQPEQEVINV